MALYIYWFLLALILVGLEMATGTFYLLIVAIAMAIGGAFALLGIAFSAQLALAALAGIAGIVLLRRWKGGHISNATILSLDTGQPVEVLIWRDDGTARVFYRGAEWNAELEAQDGGHDGVFYIKDMRGSVLILTNRKPI
jgi:membrane protein implicated in regulation of membrane protease activity